MNKACTEVIMLIYRIFFIAFLSIQNLFCMEKEKSKSSGLTAQLVRTVGFVIYFEKGGKEPPQLFLGRSIRLCCVS